MYWYIICPLSSIIVTSICLVFEQKLPKWWVKYEMTAGMAVTVPLINYLLIGMFL